MYDRDRRVRAGVSHWSRVGLAVAATVFIADRLSKYWIMEVLNLPERGHVDVLPFFDLTMVWNDGISMGMLQADTELGRWVLVGVTSLIALGMLIWLLRSDRMWIALALGCIIGGAAGNIWDRVAYGAVADFLHFFAFGWSFYVFNLADAMISIGVALLLADGLLFAKKTPN